MKRMFWLVLFVALGAALLALSACPPAGGSGGPASQDFVLSGRVFDHATGFGISGATVTYAGLAATTDSAGNYTITVPSGGSTKTGRLLVYKDVQHSFAVVEDLSFTSPGTADVPMEYYGTPSAEFLVQGSVFDNSGGELEDGGEVALAIINPNGGRCWESATYDASTHLYQCSIANFGSNCLVGVTVFSSAGSWLFSYYLKGVNLGAPGPVTLNLTQPSASAYASVSVTGTPGTVVTASLSASGYGALQDYIAHLPLTSSPQTVAVYNPDSYQIAWMTTELLPDNPGVGDTKQKIATSGLVAFSTSVTLPASPAETGPTQAVNATTAAYSAGTLSFTGAAGATLYRLVLYSTGPFCYGFVYTNSTILSFPSTFVTSVLDPGSSWQVEISPGWASREITFDDLSTPRLSFCQTALRYVEVEGAEGRASNVIP